MDLLFKRYANPYLFLDEIIGQKRFTEFILSFFEMKREDELIDVWLHKVHNKSYVEFKNSVTKIKKPDGQNLKAIISNSNNMLNGFIPS